MSGRGIVIERTTSTDVPSTGAFRAGAAVADVTPGLGTTLSGYGSLRSEPASKMCGRLFATALVLDDGHGERVALVAIDLHAGTRYLAELAAVRLAPQTGIGVGRLFLAGTHTHSGPGHLYGNTLYDGMTAQGRGLDTAGAAAIAEGIARAVEEAARTLRPARLGHGSAIRWGYSMNRSLDAFRYDGALPARFGRGFGVIPRGLKEENLAVDPRLQLLWAEALDGEPIGAFGTFGVHATAIPARHATLSADVFGCAVRATQDRLVRDGLAKGRVPFALAVGAMGDVDLDLHGIGAHAMVERQGADTAHKIGEVLAETAEAAIRAAREVLTTDVRLRVLFTEPEPAGAWLADGRRLADEAAYGVPALAGSELGRNFMLDPRRLSTALSLEGRRGGYDPEDPHAPKLMTMRGLVARITGHPAPVFPLRLVEITAAHERVHVVGVPGEPTTRFANGLERVLKDRGADHVLVAGVTGDYAGYFTTEKEYEKQHYEGACTIWGRATLGFVADTLRALHDRGAPPPAPTARFEKDAIYAPEAAVEPAHRAAVPLAIRLAAHGANLEGSWNAPAAVLPRFAPAPWIALEEERDGAFFPVALHGADVTDQTRDMTVERAARGATAAWSFRWHLPTTIRHRVLRFVLLPAAFGGRTPSNPVRIA